VSESLLGAYKFRVAVLMVVVTLVAAACASGGSVGVKSCGAGEIGTPPNCLTGPPVAAAPGKTWHVVFSEEFNGTDYDRNKLTPCFDWNYGACTASFNLGKETYKPEQVRVSDGTAKLVAEPL
jgi:hypothetical protein